MNLAREIDELSFDFCKPIEPQGVMDALVRKLVTHYGMTAAAIWRLDTVQMRLSLAASAGEPEIPASLRDISASHSLLGRAVQTRLPQIHEGASAVGDETAQWAEQRQLRFVVAYPLEDESRTLGVLLVASPGTPEDSRLKLFQLHARMASIAWRDAE